MFGIHDEALVRRVRSKLKQPAIRARVKRILLNVNRADLQNEATVRSLVHQLCTVLDESPARADKERIVRRIVAERINPNHPLQMLRLWSLLAR
jgi:hypothetical protein